MTQPYPFIHATDTSHAKASAATRLRSSRLLGKNSSVLLGFWTKLRPTLAAHRKGRHVTHVLELAASHELSYHRTKRRCPIHMLCSRYAKVNPTGIESIDHL